MPVQHFFNLIKHYAASIIGLTLLLTTSRYSISSEIQDFTSELKVIDQQHHNFSEKFHHQYATQKQEKLPSFQSIDSLENVVLQHLENDKLLATSTIVKNMPLLKNNYDSLAIIKLIKTLLDQNEWNSAKSLFDLLKQDGEITLLSNVAYLFADFSFQRNAWEQTLQHLDGAIGDLASEDYFHALLIQGISLQRLAKHRKSITIFEKILPSSKYYPAARINMAIANIRQGWWTDGHNLIQEILTTSEKNNQESTLNRLYLTLGYSFLKQEYYRNSRESFRNVSLNSLYTNQALLGIALTAANQKDYVGALNAVRILKNKETSDLPVDESFLLMPYFYEKLQQHTTASTGYSQAVSYYQGRIAGIYNILQSNIQLAEYPIFIKDDVFININNNLINLSSTYPDYFFKNYLMLENYRKYIALPSNNKLNTSLAKLKREYETIIQAMITNRLNQRVEQLNSYMDQSRYGLARLYDNNLVNK